MDRRSIPQHPFLGMFRNTTVEGFLWTILALIPITIDATTSWVVVLTFAHAIRHAVTPHHCLLQQESFLEAYWRKPAAKTATTTGDSQGISMCIVLVPILLHSMRIVDWNVYAKTFSLALVAWENMYAMALLFGVALCLDPSLLLVDNCIFMGLWSVSFGSMRSFPSLHSVFSKGEWIVVSSLACMAATECLTTPSQLDTSNSHRYIGLSGLLGCAFACSTVDYVSPTSLPIRLAVLVSIPLVGVEMALAYHPLSNAAASLPHPQSLWWLADFLLEREQSNQDISSLPSWRRIYWLVYWVAVSLITIPLAPKSTTTGTVVTRKWFHLVAVLLFAPVTVAAPVLQSLSYAIALAVLMVLECVRRDLPRLDEFYHCYLDTTKDQVTTDVADSVIVSHMGLIVGCAAPLWMSECVDWINGSNSSSQAKLLLQLWGVLSLGVGDAMGAVIGTYFGRVHWGQNRSIEGSTAMFLSMTALCWGFIGLGYATTLWLPAVVFVTLLEAFTLQIDNFVLPLAGATVILLLL